MTIVSKRGRPPPAPPAPPPKAPEPYNPRIIVNPDGSWSFPETKKDPLPNNGQWPFPTGADTTSTVDANDEEVLRRTTGGVDVNFFETGDA